MWSFHDSMKAGGMGQGGQYCLSSSQYTPNLPPQPAGQFPIDFFHLGAEMKVRVLVELGEGGCPDEVAGVPAAAFVPGSAKPPFFLLAP